MLQNNSPRSITAPSALEKQYGAELWRLGRVTVRKLVKDDPGVLKIQMGRSNKLKEYVLPNWKKIEAIAGVLVVDRYLEQSQIVRICTASATKKSVAA